MDASALESAFSGDRKPDANDMNWSAFRHDAWPAIVRILSQKRWLVCAVMALMFASVLLEGVTFTALWPLLNVAIGSGEGTNTTPTWLMPWLARIPDQRLLPVLALFCTTLIIISNAVKLLAIYGMRSFAAARRRDWCNLVLRSIIHGKLSTLSAHKHGALLNAVLPETTMAARCLTALLDVTLQIATCTVLMVLLELRNWQATMACFGISCLLALAFRRVYMDYSFSLGQQRRLAVKGILSQAAENISALKEIKSYGAEAARISSFNGVAKQLARVNVRIDVLKQTFRPVLEILACLLACGALLLFSRTQSIALTDHLPALGFFVVVGGRILAQTSTLFSSTAQIVNYAPSLISVSRLTDTQVEPEDLDSGTPFHALDGPITCRNVHFRYTADTPVLTGLDLEIPQQGITAIVGPSGSGKTTLIDLLMGFYTPNDGTIAIAGTPLEQLRLADWRKAVAVVGQESVMFNTSVADNIAFGTSAKLDQLMDAARRAHAHEFIVELPDQYETEVGDRGDKLSGGQRQRIAIARALLREPEILLLDEATSALDTISEQMIQDTVARFARKKAVLIVAHRLSTVQHADRICVINEGRVVETGSYSELTRAGGLFADMVTAGTFSPGEPIR